MFVGGKTANEQVRVDISENQVSYFVLECRNGECDAAVVGDGHAKRICRTLLQQNGSKYRQMGETTLPTIRQTDTQTDRDKHTNRQTHNRQTDKQIHRQTDTQTDTQTYIN